MSLRTPRKPRRPVWEIEAEKQAKYLTRRARFAFEELDGDTRRWMAEEFEAEEAEGNPYRSKGLSPLGRELFPELMRSNFIEGNEQTLTRVLLQPRLWLPTWERHQAGRIQVIQRNIDSSALTLARTEFLTWYIRGLSRKLLESGIEICEIYRAAPAWEPRHECLQHEGQKVAVRAVYQGHRVRYWPEPSDPTAFSLPVGSDCHDAIRRVKGVNDTGFGREAQAAEHDPSVDPDALPPQFRKDEPR